MSLPFGQPQQEQPPPSPVPINEQTFTTHHGRGSFGPVIGVLAVILILGIISAMIGRLCAGAKVSGFGRYDFEGWFSSKFRSCIDGSGRTPPLSQPSATAPAPPTETQHVAPPPPQHANGSAGGSVPIIIPIEVPQEVKPKKKSRKTISEITEL